MATLRALECLAALVEYGSVSAAASSLHLSQPALSHQIASLERELGAPVVERLWRGVRVTAAGHATAEEARNALRAAERAVQIGRRVAAGDAGQLRIACLESTSAWMLAPVLERWRSRRPEVALALREFRSTAEMVVAIEAGAIDVAVGSSPAQADLAVEVLCQEQIVAVAPPGHAFIDVSAVSLRRLAAEPFVHYDAGGEMAGWVDEMTGGAQVTLSVVLRTRSPRTAVQLVAAGMGVTVAPLSAARSAPTAVVKPLTPTVERDLVAIVAAPSDPLAQRLLADLRDDAALWPSVQ